MWTKLFLKLVVLFTWEEIENGLETESNIQATSRQYNSLSFYQPRFFWPAPRILAAALWKVNFYFGWCASGFPLILCVHCSGICWSQPHANQSHATAIYKVRMIIILSLHFLCVHRFTVHGCPFSYFFSAQRRLETAKRKAINAKINKSSTIDPSNQNWLPFI